MADAFEQFGYQQESPSVRNSFLAAALELRSGIPEGASPKTAGPDVVRAMSTERYLDFLAIRMDAKKAEGMKFKINLVLPDNEEEFVVEMSNSALTNIEDQRAKDANLTITIDRSDLEEVMVGAATFDEQIEAGHAKLEGNKQAYDLLKSTLEQFELGFEMMPGTKNAKPEAPRKTPFQQKDLPYTGD